MDHQIWKYMKISVKVKRVCSSFCKHGQWMNTHPSFRFSIPHPKCATGCEGDLVATSVTPLIARVDSADLVG